MTTLYADTRRWLASARVEDLRDFWQSLVQRVTDKTQGERLLKTLDDILGQDPLVRRNHSVRVRFQDPAQLPFAHPFYHAAFVLLGEGNSPRRVR